MRILGGIQKWLSIREFAGLVVVCFGLMIAKQTYVLNARKGDILMIILINGIAGSGKSSLAEELERRGVNRIKSATTKTPESSDGDDYIYVKDEKGLIETTEVNGNIYGTPLEEIEKYLKSDISFKIVDKKGVDFFKEKFNSKLVTFELPISVNEKRLMKRGLSKHEANEMIFYERETVEYDRDSSSDLSIKTIYSVNEIADMALGICHYIYEDDKLIKVFNALPMFNLSNYAVYSSPSKLYDSYKRWKKYIVRKVYCKGAVNIGANR